MRSSSKVTVSLIKSICLIHLKVNIRRKVGWH
jgi:hypothetical protein